MEVIFSASAFRPGYAGQDFYELLATKYSKIRSQRGLDDVYELLGRNLSGAYLHVIYWVLPDRRLRVFHINTRQKHRKSIIGDIANEKTQKKDFPVSERRDR
jgi:hypothetical protein